MWMQRTAYRVVAGGSAAPRAVSAAVQSCTMASRNPEGKEAPKEKDVLAAEPGAIEFTPVNLQVSLRRRLVQRPTCFDG